MTKTIETIFTIQKDKEYKSAIKDINSSLSVLKSEMKAATAEFQDNEGSMEALTAKGDILERTLLTQREKVEELERALSNAAHVYGESDSRTKSYAVQLNNARAAVADTEAAIRQNTEAMEEQRDAVENVSEGFSASSMSLRDFIGELGINLPPIADKALGKFGDLSIGGVGAMGAIAAAGKKVVEMTIDLANKTKESAAKVDDLVTESIKSGIDLYTLQVLHYMEDLADVDVSTVTSSIAKLTRSMSDAAGGSKTALEAFDTLGVKISENGNLRAAQDVLWDVVDALGAIHNQTERDALAMQIFGRSAQELNTLIALGGEGFRNFADEAEKAGYVLQEDQIDALGAYNDALDRAEKQMEALRDEMTSKFAPGLLELTEGWQNLKIKGLDLVINSGIVEWLSSVAGWLGNVAYNVGQAFGVLNAHLHKDEILDPGVIPGLPAPSNGGHSNSGGALTGILSGVDINDFSSTTPAVVLPAILSGGNIPGFASGISDYPGGMAWVGEAGPELVSLPRGSSVLSAQESRNIGGDTIIINAQIDSLGTLQEIIAWYQNRQRIERMG